MAYTIKFDNLLSTEQAAKFSSFLAENIQKDGRFRANIVQPTDRKLIWFTTSLQRTHKRPLALFSTKHTVFQLARIRLLDSKEYCGQHPGMCFPSPFGVKKKLKTRLLEWDDWKGFNDLVNSILDLFGEPAEMWSNPKEQLDFGNKFWLRRENKARVQYSWEDDWFPGVSRPNQIWNHGSLDQFGV